jgi:hypothetical protein
VKRALVTALWQQRLSSPMRVLLLAMMLLPGLAMAALTGSIAPAHGSAFFVAAVLAAGAIGQEVASGTLQLTFARPVPRPTYVLCRWFAAGAGGAALAAGQLVLAAAVLAARGMAPAPADVLVAALDDTLQALAGAALFVALSACVNGLGDVGLYVLAFLGAQMGGAIAGMRGWPVLARACTELEHTLMPDPGMGWLAGHGDPAWTGLATVLSTTALALAVAIVAVNRRELSYAAG